MPDSIFSKIIKGELPCYKIYEDVSTLAFLDIHPIQPGHTLVIPKKQIDQLWDLDDKDYADLMSTTKKVARRLRQMLPVERVGVQVIGVDVPHAHIQLIPFNSAEEFHARQSMDEPVNHVKLKELAAKLSFK